MTTKTPRTWIGARLSPASVAWLARERTRTGESLGRVIDRAVLTLSTATPPCLTGETIMIEQLKSRFPSLSFAIRETVTFARNEDATYMGRPPVNPPSIGPFLEIRNPMGGADYPRLDDTARIETCCAWHQDRATANGL